MCKATAPPDRRERASGGAVVWHAHTDANALDVKPTCQDRCNHNRVKDQHHKDCKEIEESLGCHRSSFPLPLWACVNVGEAGIAPQPAVVLAEYLARSDVSTNLLWSHTRDGEVCGCPLAVL